MKVNTMQKSYVNEHTTSVRIDVDLGELNQIISIIKTSVEAETEGNSNFRSNSRLLSNLRRVRHDMAEEAVREFTRVMELSE